MRDLCRVAQTSGRQLWPAAAHAEYRLALEAPAPYAAAVLIEGTGRFAPGPLPEVAASTHAWSDLAPHAPLGPAAVITMHERVVRGEDLSTAELAGPPVLELPLRLEPWEPAYALAEYHPHRAEFPSPPLPQPSAIGAVAASPRVDGGAARHGAHALRELVAAWTRASEGRADAVAVAGDAPVRLPRSVRGASAWPRSSRRRRSRRWRGPARAAARTAGDPGPPPGGSARGGPPPR